MLRMGKRIVGRPPLDGLTVDAIEGHRDLYGSPMSNSGHPMADNTMMMTLIV